MGLSFPFSSTYVIVRQAYGLNSHVARSPLLLSTLDCVIADFRVFDQRLNSEAVINAVLGVNCSCSTLHILTQKIGWQHVANHSFPERNMVGAVC